MTCSHNFIPIGVCTHSVEANPTHPVQPHRDGETVSNVRIALRCQYCPMVAHRDIGWALAIRMLNEPAGRDAVGNQVPKHFHVKMMRHQFLPPHWVNQDFRNDHCVIWTLNLAQDAVRIDRKGGCTEAGATWDGTAPFIYGVDWSNIGWHESQ